MRTFRILLRTLLEAYGSIRYSGMANLIVIGIMTVALALLGGVLQLNSTIKQISQNLDSQIEFSVYLQDSADPEAIAKYISRNKQVERVEVVGKEAAWQRFKKRFDLVDDGGGNPLPNTLHVNMRSPKYVEDVITYVKTLSGIEQISYAPELFSGLEKIRSIMFSFGIFLTLILSFGTVTIVSNTIQLVIRARSLEIEVLRLVGVDDWYIRGPFILHGIFYGLVSAILAIIPLWIFQKFVWDSFQSSFKSLMPITFNFNSGSELNLIFVALTLIGVLVCGLSSYFTTEKYIKI